MPSQNTWASVSGLYQNNCSGRVRNWVNTPNFGAVPKDEKPVNYYQDSHFSANQQARGTSWYQVSGGSPVTVAGPGFLFTGQQQINMEFAMTNSVSWNPDPVAFDNGILIQILGDISDAKVNVAVAYAEAHKTSDMILSTARRLDRAYRAFRRGNLREVAKLLNLTPKTVHKTWLEYKYGWTPLLMDVKGAAEFFAQQHLERKPRFTVRKTGKREFTFSRTTSYAAYGGGSPGTYTETLKTSYKQQRKVWLEITEPAVSQLQQLGLTNPALVAWELVPFSFVFDWFISVGNYLQGLTALNGVSVRRTMLDVHIDFEYSYHQPETTRVSGGTTYFNAAFDFSTKRQEYQRSSFTLSPASLYPPKTNSFSFQKLVTSLALIRGQYRGTSARL